MAASEHLSEPGSALSAYKRVSWGALSWTPGLRIGNLAKAACRQPEENRDGKCMTRSQPQALNLEGTVPDSR